MSETLTGGVLPPEPPPPSGESDYGGGNRRSQAVATVGTTAVGTAATGIYGTELAVPSYLLSRIATPKLNAAVAAVLKASSEEGHRVPKRGRNEWHKYDYATADDLRSHVASMIGAHGLCYSQHEVGYSPFQNMLGVHFFFILAHESGEEAAPERVTVLTRLIDNKGQLDDKALSKAWTLALKDWSKSRFSIATGDVLDDPDANHERQDARAEPRQQTQQPKQPAQRNAKNAQAPAVGQQVKQPEGAPVYQPQGECPVFAPDEPTPFILETAKEGRRDLRDAATWTNEWRKRVGGTRRINAPDKLRQAHDLNKPHIAGVAAVDANAAAYVAQIIKDALAAMGEDTRSPPETPADAPATQAGAETVDLPTHDPLPDEWLAGMLEVIRRTEGLPDLWRVERVELRGKHYESLSNEQRARLDAAVDEHRVVLEIACADTRAGIDDVMRRALENGVPGKVGDAAWSMLNEAAKRKWETLPEAPAPAGQQSKPPANEASVPSLEDEQWIDALLNEIKHAQSESLVRAWRSQAARKARFNRITKEHPEVTERVETAEAERITAIAARRAA